MSDFGLDGLNDLDDSGDFLEAGTSLVPPTPGTPPKTTPETAYFRNLRNEQEAYLPGAIAENLKTINDPNIPLPQRLETIAQTMGLLLPLQIAEGTSARPSVPRSVVLARLMMNLKAIESTLTKKRDIEITDELNPYSPKFQQAFGWFIELFHANLEKEGLDSVQINNVFAALMSDLVGWEDRLEKRLRGVSGKALQMLDNPFVREFTDGLKQSTREAAAQDAPTEEG